MLHIIESDALQDWQLKGNFYNFATGVIPVPDSYLIPFFYIGKLLPYNVTNPSTVSEFKAQLLNYSDLKIAKRTVQTNYSLTTSTITIENGTAYDWFYYDAQSDPSFDGVDGYYQFYIKILQGSDEFEFISDIWQYVGNNCAETNVGDFNEDFNNDFLI